MRNLRLLLLPALVIVCAALPASASARDTVTTSFDGTKIVTHFFPASGLAPGRKAPTVMVGHGYAQRGVTDQNQASSAGGVGVGALRAAGYNVLTWDARGFGGSGGLVEVDSPKFEGRDAQALIDYIARQPEALLDEPGDPRLGMAGASYGGGIQLVTAGIDKRVDAITPVITWNDLRSSLFKERTVKLGWSTLLSGAGGKNQDPLILRGAREGATTGTISPAVENFFATRGLPGQVDRVRAPTLLIQGTSDTLFTLNESIANYEILRGNGVPVKMVWYCGGHAPCTTAEGPENLVPRSVLAWFGRYLKPGGTSGVGAAFSYVAQDGKVRQSATFPPRPVGQLAGTSRGALALAPSKGSGSSTVATPDPAGFSVGIARGKAAFDVAGAPELSLTYSGTANVARTRVFARIVDPVRNVVLGNMDQPVPVVLDGKTRKLTIDMESIAYHGAAGARLRLQIVPASSLYTPQRATGTIRLDKVGVAVPTMSLKGKPRTQVVLGTPRGLMTARPGRPASVKVRASGDILNDVQVIARDGRGRRVGSSAAITLGAKSRTVRVRVNRKLNRGRYRITVVGTSPERFKVTDAYFYRITR